MMRNSGNYLKKAAAKAANAADESGEYAGTNPAAIAFNASTRQVNTELLFKTGGTFRDVYREEEKMAKWGHKTEDLPAPRAIVAGTNPISFEVLPEDQPADYSERSKAKSQPIPIPQKTQQENFKDEYGSDFCKNQWMAFNS